jgi:UDP-N-acetylmuramoyl-tripeptide--D-alanyl-D-alanine ligase
MIDTLGLLPIILAFMVFATRRALTYMHMLQQEEYDAPRFFWWMVKNRVFDTRLSGGLLLTAFASLFLPPFIILFVIFGLFLATAYFENDPRKDSKKKLVMTDRARRIFLTGLALMAVTSLFCFISPSHALAWLISVQAIPLCLIAAVLILQPYENKLQKKFWTEAHEKVLALKPITIGITGSFGKTSVKHILGHILKTQAPTLITPGSVNTPMGIARIVREELNESHKFFVVEMGAYGPGSIARLCRLTPPDMAVITAIGHAHYERFKTLDAVAETKFELAEAVFAKNDNGKAIVHDRTMRFEYPRNLYQAKRARFLVVGDAQPLDPAKRAEHSVIGSDDLQILQARQEPDGIDIRLNWKGIVHAFHVPLFGLHHAHNVALAFAAALQLGIEPQAIITALKSVPQIEHRLQVKSQADGTTIIDDAYNSNPAGFRSALELLSLISQNKRKILVTPGMVEMGAAHGVEHYKIGQIAGQICDVIIAVSPSRIPTFLEGARATGAGKTLIQVDSFKDASAWLAANRLPGDVILLENDLPDLYERVPRL